MLSGPRRSSGGWAVVFVSVNQVLVRPWACRLPGGPSCRAMGRLAAVARAAVVAKSDRHGCESIRSSDRRHERSGVRRWPVFCDGRWASPMRVVRGVRRARGVHVRALGCGWFLCMVALDVLVRPRRTKASRLV